MNVAIATGYHNLDFQLTEKIKDSKIVNYKEFLLDEQHDKFDTVITSKHLPGDTPERDLLFYLKNKDIRIIYITNENDIDSICTCLEFSIYDIIFDPITVEKVLSLLEHPNSFSDISPTYVKYLNGKNKRKPINTIKKVEPEIINETATITKEKIVGTLIVSVAGLQHGSGTTKTVLVIAEVLAKKGFKVGIVEFKRENEYALIHFNPNTESTYKFKYKHNIDVYANNGHVNPDELLIAANIEQYDYLILDLGLLFEYDIENAKLDKPNTLIKKYKKSSFYNEFMKADLKILTSFADIQFSDSIQYFVNYINKWDICNIQVLFNFVNTALVNYYKKNLNCNVYAMPFNIEDSLSDIEIDFYLKVLKRIIPKEKTEWKKQLSKKMEKIHKFIGQKR